MQSNIDLGDSTVSTTMIDPMLYLNIGYDLDGRCNRTPASAKSDTACRLPPGSAGILDGPEGQDDAMGHLIQLVRTQITDFSSQNYSKQLHDGAANAIIHVTGYNGLADDDKVRVEALVSAQYDGLMPGIKPTWNGHDSWPIASDSVMNNSLATPKNVDPNAYVSNHQLVATLDTSGYRLRIGLTSVFNVNLELHLRAAFIVCDVLPTDAGRWGFTLKHCTLAGRWPADDLLQQVWHFPDPLDLAHPRPLCTNSSSYALFKNAICQSPDVLSDSFMGPTNVCDAISFGVNFDTEPAELGDVYPVDTFAPPCLPQYDPSNDTCETDGGVSSSAGGASSGGATGAGGRGGASARDGGLRDSGPDTSI